MERLKVLRNRSNVTQRRFASIIGVPMRDLSSWERGEKIPPPVILSKIAKHFKVTEEWLLGKSDTIERKIIPPPTKFVFTFNYKFNQHDSLNTIYSGKHWACRKSYADGIHLIVKNALKRTGISECKEGVLFSSPVCITITFPFDGVDIDNHSYFSKCVIDCLKGMIIHDDTPKWVVGLKQMFADVDDIWVEIEEAR